MSGSEDFELSNSSSEDFVLSSVGSGLFSLTNLDFSSSVSLELPEYSSLGLVASASSINSRPLGFLKIESNDTLSSAIHSELNLSSIVSSCSKDIPTGITSSGFQYVPFSSLSSMFQDVSPGSMSSIFQDDSSGSMSSRSGFKDILPNAMSSRFKDIAPGNMSFGSNSSGFEEFSSSSADFGSNNNNQIIKDNSTKLKFNVGDPFDNWDAIQCAMVHFYLGKRVNSITITSIVDKHNYLCNSKTIKLAPKNLRFPQPILDKNENYTVVDVRIYDKSNTATMLLYLMNQKDQDHDYVVIPRIKGKFNKLTGIFWITSKQYRDPAMSAAVHIVYLDTQHLLCIYHLGENIKKKAKLKLHSNMVTNFISDFYYMRNSSNKKNFELRYNDIITKYEPCCSYLESKLYPCHESWAKYVIVKIFIASTLLKELVVAIEQELEKESFYTCIRDYYGSNLSSGLSSVYNTIFKDIDTVLKDYLAPIPLSLQWTQMNQLLLYHMMLITTNQISELLSDVLSSEIQEVWKVFYITSTKSHYVVILQDSLLFCTCMQIINFGMLCHHQFRIFIQSSNAIFHIGLIHACWFKIIPSKINMHITIAKETKSFTSTSLYHLNQIRSASVYTPIIQETVNKKLQFGTTMSIAKTSVQVTISEGVTAELIGVLTQFISKYRCTTGLNIEAYNMQNENNKAQTNDKAQTNASIEFNCQPLTDLNLNCNLTEVSNPEYHKSRGHPPKRLKLSIEKEAAKPTHEQRICSYCLNKEHNIHGCTHTKLI
ncbi:35884_t:CDS:2, partial [Gigaspora margarita]